jgi:hypothetical protein
MAALRASADPAKVARATPIKKAAEVNTTAADRKTLTQTAVKAVPAKKVPRNKVSKTA